MKLPFERRSDDWVFGALLAAVLASAVGLNGAWVREVKVAREAAASAPRQAAAPATTQPPEAHALALTAVNHPYLP